MNERTDRSILRSLTAMAVPIVLANTIQTSHQLINTFWVGRLGADAVAAVSVSFPVIFLLVSLGGGLSIAGSILAAHHVGAGDPAGVNRVAGQTLGLTIAVSLLLTASGLLLSPLLLDLMQVAPAVHADALAYMRISFLGIVCGFSFVMYQALARAIGDTRRPLYLIMAGVALNLVLDPILIFGWGPLPGLGVAGAAWATLAAQTATALAGIRLLFGGRHGLHVRRADLRPDWPLVSRVVRLGLPASLEQSMQALGISTVTLLVAAFGTEAIAAYGIGFRVLTFVIIPAFGISIAASTLVSQSIGAGDIVRAEHITRVSALLGIAVLGTAGAAIAILATPIAQAFVPNDAGVVQTAASALRWMAISFALMGLQLSLAGTFRGAGDTLAAMLLSAIGTWLVQLPIAWLLAHQAGLGVRGIWMTYPLAGLVNTLIALLYWRHGRWRRLRLVPLRATPGSAADAAETG